MIFNKNINYIPNIVDNAIKFQF
ncbi:hypothetical protein c7_L1252 [Megavirus courdo7]|uniref:Uncharacterized protein n=1 Tax=Megavirus courdo7 TaxID=1128135 RepID=H2ECH6_9VIRU|nr:hypothetical protein c7_L1252 [Megavirus courdo7]